jgi:SNF2 family DNA or RNA helicase
MSKPRKRVIIIDSDSSDGENQSIFSINSSDHGNRPVNNSSANIEDLTTSLSRVVLAPYSQKEWRIVAGTRKYGKGGLDALTFNSDSDSDSSLEVFIPTFATKPRRMEDASAPSEPSVIAIEDSDSDKETGDENIAKRSTDSPWTYDDTVDEYSLVSRGKKVKMPDFRIPASLYNRLFDHQKDGVAWMAGLHSPGVGGLLGDDMGMGKTYMALTLLGGLMRDKTIRNCLIVAPLSVLRSWETEAEKVLKICVPRVRVYVVSSDIGKATRCKRLQDALEW